MKNHHASLPTEGCDLLFAYGTLITGQAPLSIRRLMSKHMRWVGEARTKGILYDLGAYPGMTPGQGWVWGQVWRMSSPAMCLEQLDAYEDFRTADFDSEYVRRLGEVELLLPPEKVQAWIYYYNGSLIGRSRLREGDYRKGL